jgi:hypothetical protein
VLAPLAPGQYGDVTINSGGALTFKSGTYYLRALKIQSNGTLKLDQANGPVIIYVETDQVNLRGAISSLTGAAPDLLIVYLGTLPLFVESLFNGALVAPFTVVTLRAVTGTHTGFFYAKDLQILDAHAKVQYRAPLAIIKAANPGSSSCPALVSALVPPAEQQAAITRYCGACPSPADTDRDGPQDCVDGCPYDPLKTAPGLCGCGVSELDSDVDGVPNCLERCNSDAANVATGQCGCLGEPDLQPNGTPCSDTPGPQTNATCNNGMCGNPTVNRPNTGCRLVRWRSSAYWLCLPPGAVGGSTATPLTRSAAQQACSAKGLALARIDSADENRFLRDFLKAPAWIGANSITTANNWRWSTAATDNGDQFWAGAVSGARVSARYHNWSVGAPSTQRCAAMIESDGRWSDVPCTQALGYICEYRTPVSRTTTIVPPGMPRQPPPATQCISETQAALPAPGPAGEALLQQQVNQTAAGTPTGPFVNPPTSGTCPDDPLADGIRSAPGDAGCEFVPADPVDPCVVDSDCAAGLRCRSTKESQSCAHAVRHAALPHRFAALRSTRSV